MRPYVLFLVTSLSFLKLMHVFSTYIVIVIFFSLCHKALHFLFLIYLNLFLFCTTFSALNSCDQTGNYTSEQMQTSQPCKVQPVPSTEPKAPCQKPNLLVWQEIFFPFIGAALNWTQRRKLHLRTPKVHV